VTEHQAETDELGDETLDRPSEGPYPSISGRCYQGDPPKVATLSDEALDRPDFKAGGRCGSLNSCGRT